MSVRQIGIAVVEHAGRFLVGMRAADQVLAGYAEFPGGKCEPDEQPQACAIRECREETGLPVEAVKLLHRVQFQYPHGAVDLHFWMCRPVSETEIEPANGFRWVQLAELASLPFPEANLEVLAMLQATDRQTA